MSPTNRLWHQQTRFLTTFAPSTRPLPRPSNTIHHLRPRAPRPQRFQSSKPHNPTPSSSPSSSSSSSAQKTQRARLILDRASRFVPRRLHPYLQRLRTAPFSHVAAFLALHELTALAPLFGLAYLFHSADWVPTAWVFGPWAAWAEEGLSRYMGYFRKKGWFGLGEGGGDGGGGRDGEERLEERLRQEVERERVREKEGRGGRWFSRWWGGNGDVDDTPGGEGEAGAGAEQSKTKAAWKKVKGVVTTENTEKGYKIGVQIAAAYAITKMLLIPRIALSLWATPWLARGFVAARRSIWRKRS
ncbi:uncharacterized protein F4807DRAFT_466230 [Annulohypoxylon truncatum]|uniref:uncharacterized protein n=1 Tax=Annulohypoxylon truncatum TaxID=327061 RepID=UPI0020081872|nr:uncharacterized protein F4807DRAFT_466230 [Annulohypoxylon truncatum]KAI1214753.1 hypothetical protein F4807DRAFT_466230 [Annulohypoxylon truncatum]